MSFIRAISWIKTARKDFESFPVDVQKRALFALSIAAAGGKADIVKPLKGFDSGVLEIVIKNRGDAFRVIYAVQIGDDLWVLHAFQKKSTDGIKTPKRHIDVIHERIKKIKEL